MTTTRVNISPRNLAGALVKMAIAAALLVLIAPPLRARAAPYVAPLAAPVHRILTQDRVNTLARYLAKDVSVTGHAPQDGELRKALHKMFPKRLDQAVDPWGQRYYLRRRLHSFHVGSAGPDRRRGTADDILSTEREIVGPPRPDVDPQ